MANSVVQLDNPGPVGTIAGMVGGYLLGNPERKAKKAQLDIENKRNADNDARLSDEQKTNAANVADAIKDRDINTGIAKTKSDATALSNNAFQTYMPMLENPPTTDGKPLHGPALAKALYNIKNTAFNKGMTDPQDSARFDAEIARITQADQAQHAQSFAGKEMALPGDPKQRLGVLLKRQQAERAVPGLDPKPTQDAIAATQKQITEAQAAAYQNANLAERKNHDATVEGQGAQRLGIEATRADRIGSGNSIGAEDLAERKREFAIEHPTDPKTGKALPKAAAKETTPEARGADYAAAANAIAKGADRGAVVQRFAAKWQLTPDKADALFP